MGGCPKQSLKSQGALQGQLETMEGQVAQVRGTNPAVTNWISRLSFGIRMLFNLFLFLVFSVALFPMIMSNSLIVKS